jgi:AraC family ethanolamine operon transcriptional activator
MEKNDGRPFGSPLTGISSHHFTDVDQVPQVLTGVDARMWLAGPPSTGAWSLVNAQLDNSDLMYGRMAGPFCSAAAVHERSVLVILKLDGGARWSMQGSPFTEREIVVVRPGAEYAIKTDEPGEWSVIRLDADHFLQHATTMEGGTVSTMREAVRVLRPAQYTLGSLRGVIRAVVESVPGADTRAMRALGQSLRHHALNAVSCRPETQRRPVRADNAKVVRVALRYLDDHEQEPVYLADLCAATGSSERALRRAFQAIYRMSPMGFLRIRRLSQARRALITGRCNSVTEAAMLYAFFDVGRFAAAYRKLFGELPSAALR